MNVRWIRTMGAVVLAAGLGGASLSCKKLSLDEKGDTCVSLLTKSENEWSALAERATQTEPREAATAALTAAASMRAWRQNQSDAAARTKAMEDEKKASEAAVRAQAALSGTRAAMDAQITSAKAAAACKRLY